MELGHEYIRESYKRIPAIGLVRFRSAGKSCSGYLVNICHEGLMIKAKEQPGLGEEVSLTFQLLPFDRVFHLKAVVLWITPRGNGGMLKEIGTRFTDLVTEDRKYIEKYIDSFYAL